MDLGLRGKTVLLPGPTRSEGVATFVRSLAAPQSVTEAEVERGFFASARPTPLLASATTGASLRVDGGVVRSIA
jgi:hypothetical protein